MNLKVFKMLNFKVKALQLVCSHEYFKLLHLLMNNQSNTCNFKTAHLYH